MGEMLKFSVLLRKYFDSLLPKHLKDGAKRALSCAPPGGLLFSKGEQGAEEVLAGLCSPCDPEQTRL